MARTGYSAGDSNMPINMPTCDDHMTTTLDEGSAVGRGGWKLASTVVGTATYWTGLARSAQSREDTMSDAPGMASRVLCRHPSSIDTESEGWESGDTVRITPTVIALKDSRSFGGAANSGSGTDTESVTGDDTGDDSPLTPAAIERIDSGLFGGASIRTRVCAR